MATVGLSLVICHFSFGEAQAQQLLSLDSCRVMALRNNKQLSISKLKQDVAANLRPQPARNTCPTSTP